MDNWLKKHLSYENISAAILLSIVIVMVILKILTTGPYSINRFPSSYRPADRGDFDHSPYDDHGGTIQY